MTLNLSQMSLPKQALARARMSTARTQRLLNRQLNTPRWISIDRARIFTQAMTQFKFDPLPIRRAKAFREVLTHIPIAIQPGELLVGGLTERPNGAILFPEVSPNGMKPLGPAQKWSKNLISTVASSGFNLISALLPAKKGLRPMVDLFIELLMDNYETRPTHQFKIADPIRNDLSGLVDFWQKRSAIARFYKLVPPETRKRMGTQQLAFAAVHQFTGGVKQFHIDFGMILQKGIASIVMEAKEGLAHGSEGGKTAFFEASAIALEGLLAFADRYATLAAAMADSTTDPKESAELLSIAEVCQRVPRQPARTFREAFQAFWFVYLALVLDDGGMEIPFGRLDQFLWPYYRGDLAAGRITPEQALELIEAFFIKASEMEFLLDNGANRVEDGSSARMTLTLGGVNREGADATNALTGLFLDVAAHARTIQPNVAVRIHPQIAPIFYNQILNVLASGANTIQLFNDEVIIAGLTHKHIALADARDYVLSGCVQPLPFGAYGSTCASHIYLPRTLLLFLAEKKGSEQSFQGFYAAYQEFFKTIVAQDVAAVTAADQAHLLLPNPLVSALIPGALEKGVDVKGGGARYNLTGVSLSGIGTLVDSLTAIRKLVFEQKALTLQQLNRMLTQDFYGSEIERQRILNKLPKYGNDDPDVDNLAGEFTHFVAAEFEQYQTFRGGPFLLGMHTEANHVLFGLLTGATPDGRHQGEPFSVGAGTAGGRDRSGYTAFLNSILHHDFTQVCGGSSVNIRVNPKILAGEGQLRRFGEMIRTYFDKGGPHIQVNVVSTDTLRDAQVHPEKYGDMLVRVSGFSARFIDLTRQTQDEIIARSEQ